MALFTLLLQLALPVYAASDSFTVADKITLKSGDVIQSVNGKKVKNNLDAMMALEKVKKAKHIELEVLRDGKLQKIVHDDK